MWTKMQVTHKNLKEVKNHPDGGSPGGPGVKSLPSLQGNRFNPWLGAFCMPPGTTTAKITQMILK